MILIHLCNYKLISRRCSLNNYMVHIVIHDSKVRGKFELVDMGSHRRAAFADRLASDIEDLTVLPSRVHFVGKLPNRRGELRQ